LIGSYESKFKQVNIQKTKNGSQYIVADKKRFWVDRIEPVSVSKEILERRLAEHISLKNTFIQMKQEGIDVRYSIENQEFFIENIKKYLKGVM